MYVLNFPLCLRAPERNPGFLWQFLLASLCSCEHWGRPCPWRSIWQWSSIPMSVWKVLYVCCSRRALSHIGFGLMGWCPGIYTCVGICGKVMHMDLWSFFYSRKEGALMWLFPPCWQQQSKWRVLLLETWCYHDKWGGKWRTQKIRRNCQTLCPLGAHSSNGGIWGHGRGGMPIFSLVTRAHFWKAAVMWEGSIRAKESLIFMFVCLEAEVSLRAMRPTRSDAKLMGGGWTWSCRPLHFALSQAFRSMSRRSKRGDHHLCFGHMNFMLLNICHTEDTKNEWGK